MNGCSSISALQLAGKPAYCPKIAGWGSSIPEDMRIRQWLAGWIIHQSVAVALDFNCSLFPQCGPSCGSFALLQCSCPRSHFPCTVLHTVYIGDRMINRPIRGQGEGLRWGPGAEDVWQLVVNDPEISSLSIQARAPPISIFKNTRWQWLSHTELQVRVSVVLSALTRL